jgi:hypothetical protein
MDREYFKKIKGSTNYFGHVHSPWRTSNRRASHQGSRWTSARMIGALSVRSNPDAASLNAAAPTNSRDLVWQNYPFEIDSNCAIVYSTS